MKHRKWPIVAVLILCGGVIAVKPLFSADDAQAPAEPPPPKIVTKIYDIRGLIAPPDDFPFNSSEHAQAFVVPPSQQGSLPGEAYGNGGGGGFRSSDPPRSPSREESAQQVIKLITDDVDSDTWRDNGGIQGSIHYIDGSLIIRQTESAQMQIRELLQRLTELRNRPVRTTAEWLVLPLSDAEKLLKSKNAADSGAAREVDAAAFKALPAATTHYHVELPGHNGQTLHAVSGNEKNVTVNVTAIVGTGVAAYQPVIGLAGDGIALEVTPNVDYERKTAVVNLWSAYNAAQPNGPLMTLHSYATTEPTPDAKPVESEASASYHETLATIQELRTTIRIPLNTPVIAGAMTLLPASGEKDDRQLVLIVCVHAADKPAGGE